MAGLNTQISKKKLLLLGFLVVALITIPLTVFLVQQQVGTRSEATPATTLSFSPNQETASVGESVDLDIVMSPGSNSVSYVKLVIKYDPTKLAADETSFSVNPTSKLIIQEGPVVGADTIAVTLITGSDPTRVITQDTTIGTISFFVENPSDLPTDVSFDNTVRIASTASSDASDENVFLNGNVASITILGGEDIDTEPTPEATPSGTLDPEEEEEEEDVTSGYPTCSAIALDTANTGVAPYTITFSASGTDIDGVITSVTFDFGDGTAEEITDDENLGLGTIDISRPHTYDIPGSYTASVILTDDEGNTSELTNCTTSITITDEFGDTGETEDEETTEEITTTEISTTPVPTVTPLPPTGPAETIVGIGALGGILVIVGTLLFFAL